MIAWPAKDPAEVLDYSWTVAIDVGDTIESATATVSAGTVTISASPTFANGIVTLFLSGGATDEIAQVSLTAVTEAGRTFREAAVLPIIDRASTVLAAFRLRYPAFVTVSDGQASYWLADGGTQVSAWAEADKQAGRLAYAAHKLAEQGLGGALPSGVTRFKSGTFDAQISNNAAKRTGFHATAYGREFLDLARRSFAGPRLAHTPTVSI